jgi:hypothetical protein
MSILFCQDRCQTLQKGAQRQWKVIKKVDDPTSVIAFTPLLGWIDIANKLDWKLKTDSNEFCTKPEDGTNKT